MLHAGPDLYREIVLAPLSWVRPAKLRIDACGIAIRKSGLVVGSFLVRAGRGFRKASYAWKETLKNRLERQSPDRDFRCSKVLSESRAHLFTVTSWREDVHA